MYIPEHFDYPLPTCSAKLLWKPFFDCRVYLASDQPVTYLYALHIIPSAHIMPT